MNSRTARQIRVKPKIPIITSASHPKWLKNAIHTPLSNKNLPKKYRTYPEILWTFFDTVK